MFSRRRNCLFHVLANGITLKVLAVALFGFSSAVRAQIDSGSNGSDGALDLTGLPSGSTHDIFMPNHSNGIYNYTYVNIPFGITVSFTPNQANTPVVWLVQESCEIYGSVNINGKLNNASPFGGAGGPGGFRGGNAGGGSGQSPGPGLGPGGGTSSASQPWGGSGSFGTAGQQYDGQANSGAIYGSDTLIPLVGGSGGGGSSSAPNFGGGGGGGGAILIAANGTIAIFGEIQAKGGQGVQGCGLGGGGGSGGAIRLIASTISGNGTLNTQGGIGMANGCSPYPMAGSGRVRLEAFSYGFTGNIYGGVSTGLTGIILEPEPGAQPLPSLRVVSVGSFSISNNPGGLPVPPDVTLPSSPGDQVSITVRCENVPLNTLITVDVKPANGPGVSATGYTISEVGDSTYATVFVDMPPGGGTIQAHATTPYSP